MGQRLKRKNDDSLLKKFRAGNQVAFRELYLRYEPLIKSIIVRYNPDYSDYSQEIWIMMLTKLDKFTGGNFHSWIYKMAENYCIDQFRKNKRNPIKLSVEFMDALYVQEDYEGNYEIRFIQAFKHFDSLNDLQRRVVYYRLLGYPFGKIASILKKPYGTCTPAFTSGVVKLRIGLVKDGIINDNSISLDLRKYNTQTQKRIKFNVNGK